MKIIIDHNEQYLYFKNCYGTSYFWPINMPVDNVTSFRYRHFLIVILG